MALVEGVLREVRHLVKDVVRDLFRDPVGNASRDALLGVSEDKVGPLLLHDRFFFLRHGAPHQVAPAQGIARQVPDDLHDLLLVDDASVGRLQDRLQLRALVADGIPVVLSLQVPRDKVHGARTVEGDACDNVLQRGGLQLLHEALHPSAFQLEHALGLAAADHLHDLRVIEVDLQHVDVLPAGFRGCLRSVLDHCQGPEAQEVHLEESQFLQCIHGELGGDGAVGAAGQRHILIDALLRDDDARRVHGGMAGQTLQTLREVDQLPDFRIRLVGCPQFLAYGKRSVQRHTKLIGDHLRDRVTAGIGKVQDPSHIPNHPLRLQRSEGNDLYDPVLSVLPDHIVDDLLPTLKGEVHVDIRHGHALRVQEALKDQLIPHGVDVGNAQTVGHDGSRRRTSARPHADAVGFRVIDVVPDDQEIVDIAHAVNNAELIIHPLRQGAVVLRIPAGEAFPAECVQIAPGVRIAVRNVVGRQLHLMEGDGHIAALRDLVGAVQGFRRIGKEPAHLFLGLQIVLTALIAHAVRVADLLSCLDAQKDVVGFGIVRVGIVRVVRRDERNPCLGGKAHESLVHQLLLRDPVILQFQEKVVFPEDLPVVESCLLCLLILPACQGTGDFPGKTGGACDDALMEFFQSRVVHPGPVIKPVGEAAGDDLHEVRIAGIVLRKEDQVIIPLLSLYVLPVKTGARRHVDLAAQNGADPGFLRCFIEIDHAVHDAVVGDGKRIHAQLLRAGNDLLHLAGAVQQGKLCMHMQMCECQAELLSARLVHARYALSGIIAQKKNPAAYAAGFYYTSGIRPIGNFLTECREAVRTEFISHSSHTFRCLR